MIRYGKLFLVGLAPVMFSACSGSLGQFVQDVQTNAKEQLAQLSTGEATTNNVSYQRLTDTDLNNIFERSPYRKGEAKSSYHRVAITVLRSPPKNTPSPSLMGPKDNPCYDYELVKWSDAKTSKKYDLKWCFKNDTVYEIAHRDSMNTKPILLELDSYWDKINTGRKRTVGPNMPETIMPNDIKHKSFLYGGLGVHEVFVGSLMFQMGYDWSYTKDRRFWFVKFNDVDNVRY